jgi:hypothetical protein
MRLENAPTLIDRNFSLLAAPILIIVALLGYLAGHGRSAAAPPPPVEKTRTISAATVTLDYPAGWQTASAAPKIPGLSLAHATVVAPEGEATQAGLVTGQLPAGEPSPLPSGFVAKLHALPHTEVVSLPETQAYRYTQLNISGFALPLTLYAIPDPGGHPTAVACYATNSLAAFMRTCELIAARLKLAVQAQSYVLTPDSAYARQVSALLGPVSAARAMLRRETGSQPAPAVVQRLEGAIAQAATSLSALQPPPAAGQAQAALSNALWRARDAYAALAAATGTGSPGAYSAAQARVSTAEASVDAALGSFALLGYAQR